MFYYVNLNTNKKKCWIIDILAIVVLVILIVFGSICLCNIIQMSCIKSNEILKTTEIQESGVELITYTQKEFWNGTVIYLSVILCVIIIAIAAISIALLRACVAFKKIEAENGKKGKELKIIESINKSNIYARNADREAYVSFNENNVGKCTGAAKSIIDKLK